MADAADAPAAGEVPEGVRCRTCGYELRGLPTGGKCPECGTLVADSMQGNLLRYSDPAYVAKLHLGVFLVQAEIIGMILLMFADIGVGFALGVSGSRSSAHAFAVINGLLGVALSGVRIWGWWLFSEPDAKFAGVDRGDRWRERLRALVIASAGISIISVVNQLAPALLRSREYVFLFGLVSLIVTVASFFVEMKYLQWLTPRLPDDTAYRRAKRLMWLGPLLCTVGAVVFGLGLLIALVMYWNMLDWIRKDIKDIRGQITGARAELP